ncbi:hypothetical protein QOZ80_1BG0081960 [Eleusine coracana subsp. coracana]|nr:hypothetical protein QOZ80_1BG0081960 [Eleusine coracana subsp. coracana]
MALVVLCMGCLPSCVSAMGGQIPKPPPDLNFTIGVEGVVWCKGCRYSGYNKSVDASPLPKAQALLRCRRGDWQLSLWNTTDAEGYFLIQTDKHKQVTPYTSKDCKVYVPRSPSRGCSVPVAPARKKGSPIKFRRFVPLSDELQARYTAGNFTFAPENPAKC